MKRILIIPHIKVQNANALSSPYTIGFPAMTAWLGAVHALQRKLNSNGYDLLKFSKAGVVCHQFNLQTYKGPGDYVHSIVGTGNPAGRDGKRPSFIEEGRCHLDVTLLVEYRGISKDDEEDFCLKINNALLGSMKIAGGDILKFNNPEFLKIEDDNDKDFQKLIRKLMPGYLLIERRDLMLEAMNRGLDGIDALLEYLKIMHRSEIDENNNVKWESRRKAPGWIVPVSTGFLGISDPGKAENQRDPDTPHRFAESIVTLGEFIMPYRIKNIDDMLWHYHVDIENDLYLCQQNTGTN